MVMGIFYSNYRKLVKENNDELLRLPQQDWEIFERMMKYMASFHLSRFELEVIKKDLIGMAGEAKLEGIEFSDRLGMPEKEFCDRLIKDAARQGVMERAIPAVRNAMLVVLGFYMLEWLLEGTPAIYGVTNKLILLGGTMAVLTLLDGLYDGREIYMSNRWKRIAWKAFLLIVMVSIMQLDDFVFEDPSVYYTGIFPIKFVVMGNGKVILAALAVLSAAVYFWCNYYYDRCLKRYL